MSVKMKFEYKRGIAFGFDFSWRHPEMDYTEYSPDEEVPIQDRMFRFAIGFLCWVFSIEASRNVYEIKKARWEQSK